MKQYDEKNKVWVLVDNAAIVEKNAMRQKLRDKNIPFQETGNGIFINDADESKILNA